MVDNVSEIFAIRDKVADQFEDLFTRVNSAVAARDFQRAVNDGKSPYNEAPDDYALYCFGTYDPTTGSIVLSEVPQLIAEAKGLKTTTTQE